MKLFGTLTVQQINTLNLSPGFKRKKKTLPPRLLSCPGHWCTVQKHHYILNHVDFLV